MAAGLRIYPGSRINPGNIGIAPPAGPVDISPHAVRLSNSMRSILITLFCVSLVWGMIPLDCPISDACRPQDISDIGIPHITVVSNPQNSAAALTNAYRENELQQGTLTLRTWTPLKLQDQKVKLRPEPRGTSMEPEGGRVSAVFLAALLTPSYNGSKYKG
ncbi:MAG TPA: hypothetical protein GXX51_08355 [Firmicutes bacterium]|nr:hypothetical protein [Bacillota bacterium]